MLPSIWIFAGGTGGHISPGVSLADALLKNKYNITFFTLKKNFNYPTIQDLIKSTELKVVQYEAHPIPKNATSLLRFFVAIIKSFLIFNKEKKRGKPSTIICMGGYPCFPPLLWVRIQRISYYLAEQNAILGKITRIFSSKAEAIFLSFPVELKNTHNNFIITGNPLRKELLFFNSENKQNKKYQLKNILLIGGSQGASDINQLYLILKNNLFFKNIYFSVITGEVDYKYIKNQARNQDKISKFIKDMRKVLLWSDCIIARGGSGVIFEILSAIRPMILIPYPYATDNHQAVNAQFIEQKGLGYVVDIRPFDANTVAQNIHNLLEKGLVDIHKNLIKHDFPLNADNTVVQYLTEKLQ